MSAHSTRSATATATATAGVGAAHPVGFPKAARLLKTDEYSSVFRLRPWARSAHFVLYGRYTGNAARLGLVVGRKFAQRAVTRNLVKRAAREAFRVRRAAFDGWDILLRVHSRVERRAWPSATSPSLKRCCRMQCEALLDGAAQRAARRQDRTSERLAESADKR